MVDGLKDVQNFSFNWTKESEIIEMSSSPEVEMNSKAGWEGLDSEGDGKSANSGGGRWGWAVEGPCWPKDLNVEGPFVQTLCEPELCFKADFLGIMVEPEMLIVVEEDPPKSDGPRTEPPCISGKERRPKIRLIQWLVISTSKIWEEKL